VRRGWRSGLLLPQVAEENGLGPEEFLEQTLLKAGIEGALAPDDELFAFSATVF